MMPTLHSRHTSPGTTGSTLLVVLIITVVLGLISASLIGYALTERRLNHTNMLRFQAKNAAEAALEYAAAETRSRLTRNLNFAANEFSAAPIVTHGNRLSTLLPTAASDYNWVTPANVTLWVSQVSSATRRYIDPNNAGNDFDPLRGQNVSSQAVRFVARAKAVSPTGAAVSYSTQSIEIRDAALFNYAIFYNLDMEFHPSPLMRIVGPVHANEDSYLTESGGIYFMDTFTTAGGITIGTKNNPSSRPGGRNIYFSTGVDDNGDGNIDLISVNNPTINGSAVGTYIDSQLQSRVGSKNFRDIASQAWNGYVQDSSHGINRQTPPGVLSAAQAHDLIEPPDTASGTASIESQKFSNKAGLYFLVEPGGNIIGFHTPADAEEYKDSASRAAWLATYPQRVITPPAGLIENQRRMYDHREGRWINTIDFDLGVMKTAVLSATPAAPENFKVNGADWDIDDPALDGAWNGIVYVDVENPTSGYASSGLSYHSSASTTVNQGAGSGTRTAVRLLNASELPNRRAADPANAALPEGLTFATNAAVYTIGHYNADGSLAADLSDMTTPEANEVPAAIVADAVNILSAGWQGTDALTGQVVPVDDLTSSSTSRPAASHTEVSAAILTGIVETTGTNNNQYSGGVENYPRFHENWGGRSLRYRGSIVALFTSEVATGVWASARYGAPRREWGFNSMFGSQRRYPPGTPIIRTFRRLDYRDVSESEFNALLANADLAFTQV